MDKEGGIHHGIVDGNGTAELLAGELFSGLCTTRASIAVAKLLAPLVPVNILCIGLNYHAHAEETGQQTGENPILFMKSTSTLNHPGAPIILPACCQHGPEVDYEAELAVVIGREGKNIPEEDALDHVLGYTCANDVSARRWQKHSGGGQWVRGKSFDSFCPLGPALVTTDEIPDPQNLQVRCLLNGTVMQDGNTSDMIFPVSRLIADLSRDTTLLPGTVIMTGTPAGVGVARKPPQFLSSGDVVTIEIEGIGDLVNPVTTN